jgi:LPS O-antigen subunit length determinant protein (WzzB/FepE family)
VPEEIQESNPKTIASASPTFADSLLSLMRLAHKQKKLIAITILTIIVLAGSVALLLPNHYTATILILPPQQGSSTGCRSSAAWEPWPRPAAA